MNFNSGRVLIDARVTGMDGIGRYTRSLLYSVNQMLPYSGIEALELVVRGNTFELLNAYYIKDKSKHYTCEELTSIADAAKQTAAQLLFCTDYRIPLCQLNIPLVVFIHDIFRYTNPELCYSNEEFQERYGKDCFSDVCRIVEDIKDISSLENKGSIREFDASISYHQQYYQLMLNLAIQRADMVLVPSYWVRSEIERHFDVTEKIEVVPYGINHWSNIGNKFLSDFQDLEHPYLIYVGQDRPHKNVNKLLEAFSLVCQSTNSDQVKLLLVGKDFQNNQSVNNRIKEKGLQDRVVQLGKVEDQALIRIYQQASALIHLASFEGFGFTPLEALYHGIPVIVADISIMRETLSEFATFVNPDNIKSVADKIVDIIHSSEFLPIGKRSAAIAHASKYTWETAAIRTLQYWTEAICRF